MPNQLKQLIIDLRQSFSCRAAGGPARLAAVAAVLAVGVSGSFAGNATEKAAKRWVIGAQVNLRAQPVLDAEVVKRLALNTEVSLLATLPGGKLCEVALPVAGESVMRGFTACQYLGTEPLSKQKINQQYLENGKLNPDYNPQQAFWLVPSYEALAAYGEYLEATRLSEEQRADIGATRSRDEEFERMKAHLAKGIFGPSPAPYAAWNELKHAASEWEQAQKEVLRAKLPKYGTSPVEELQQVANRHPQVRVALGTYDIDDVSALGLVSSIELSEIKPSLFQRMDDLAPPSELAEQVSGRFGMVHLIQTRGREQGSGDNKWIVPGSWDIGQVVKSLTRPVTRNTLFRDGRLLAENTRLKRSFLEWSEADSPMCDGYTDGYAFGDSDPKIWTGYGLGKEGYRESLKRNPKNSLMYFYTRTPLPENKVVVSTTRQKLEREATGFVAATTFHFDLNGDGIPDISVWEGSGQAAGHMDGPTKTDDAHQRIFFANIAGRWYVLGRDSFGYGCGC
jgi:hypothetical protein